MTLSLNYERDLLFIDTEATGLVTDHHVVCQWGSVLFDKKTLEIKSEFKTELSLSLDDVFYADKQAREIHGINLEALIDRPDLPNISMLRHMIEKHHGDASNYHVYGVHVNHDIAMLDHMALAQDTAKLFPGDAPYKCRVYSVEALWNTVGAMLSLGWGNCALRQMCKYFQIPMSDNHDALEDARSTGLVHKEVVKMIRPGS